MADPDAFPRRFGSYVLLKPLARGGMGDLYLAIGGARGMERLCVIKKVLPHLVAPDNVKRFRDEAMVVVRLSHGNLVTVFDAGRRDDEIYLAMDYIDGKDLLAVWNRCAEKRVPFPVDVLVYIVKELARGLGYAHAFGGLNLVHRDVSPANVLLSYTGEVKLTDFGLATSTLKLQHTAPGIIFGKLSYLAPEQARSEPLDGRTDIYAAGILLWELLTGQQLFPVKAPPGNGSPERRDATADALARLRNPNVVPPSSITSRVPPELDRIVMRALAAERAFRYQNGEELRADLAAFLAKTAPETDADRLAKFMRPLFADEIVSEEAERHELVQHANNLLSTVVRGPAGPSPAAPAPTGSPAPSGAVGSAAAALGSNPGGDDPRIGSTIGGRYLVRRLCGEGAMGRVYEGHHVDIGRRVAIKILHSNFRHSDELVERFRREARAASRIGHPNIVDVTDSGTTADGAFYFVMEYLDGISLESLMGRERTMAAPRAIAIAAQICRALQAAHAADIVHRDLKPANVMLVNHREEEDFVKVLDFGISKHMDMQAAGPRRAGITRPDVAVGTPIYMSPEQAAGISADARADIYAVGGLLYEMLSGVPPCDGDDVIAVLSRKATEDPVPLRQRRPEVPPRLEVVVMRALARNPGERQPSMAVLKDELVSCLTAMHAAVPTPEPVLRSQAGSTARTRVLQPRPWMMVAAALALGAVLGFWSLLPDGHSAHRARPVAGASKASPELAATPAPATTAANASPPAPAPGPLPVPAAAPAPEPTSIAVEWPATASPGFAQPPAPPSPTPAPSPPPSVAPQARVAPASRARPGLPMGLGSNRPASPSAIAAARALPTGNEILGRAQVAFNRGDYPEAIRRGKEAIGAGAAAAGHLLLGDAYYHLERYTEAMREYQTTLNLDPGNAQARRGRDLARSAASGTASAETP